MLTLNVSGLKELESAIKEIGEEMGLKAMNTALYAGAGVVKKAAKSRAPVGSRTHWIGKKSKGMLAEPGNMQRVGFAIRKRRQEGKSAAVAVQYSGKAFYGKFFELGSAKMQANSILVPAYYETVGDAVEAVKEKLRIAAERMRQRMAAVQ